MSGVGMEARLAVERRFASSSLTRCFNRSTSLTRLLDYITSSSVDFIPQRLWQRPRLIVNPLVRTLRIPLATRLARLRVVASDLPRSTPVAGARDLFARASDGSLDLVCGQRQLHVGRRHDAVCSVSSGRLRSFGRRIGRGRSKNRDKAGCRTELRS